MMPVHVRVCRECGEEYRPGVVTCADCGGELEDRYLGDESAEEEGGSPVAEAEKEDAAEPAIDLSRHREVFESARASDLVPLAERLRAAGVPFHLFESPGDEEGRAARYSLLVPDEEVDAAKRTLAPLLAPGEAQEGDESLLAQGGYSRCPACGTERASGASECAECGLALAGGEEATCSRCGTPRPSPDAACPACGAPGAA
jgi:hypothetical protein